MTNRTYRTNSSENASAFSHGGYRNLKSYQTTTLIYDFTMIFTEKYIRHGSRTRDQMEQAARSGRQNIAEGSQASATSKKTELKLVGVARASLEELLIDYEDYLRQHHLEMWNKNHPKSIAVRQLGYSSYRSYETYSSYLKTAEDFCNTLLCLIHQANFLLDRQIQSLEKSFIKDGGYTENLFKKRMEKRR